MENKTIMELFDKSFELILSASDKDHLRFIIKQVCEASDFVKTLLSSALDPDITFGVKLGKGDNERPTYNGDDEERIITSIHSLSSREVTGNDARELCHYLTSTSKYIGRVINKDLRCGLSWGTFTKIFPEVGFDFEGHVPKANRFDQYKGDIFKLSPLWLASRKLDGIRCLMFMYKDGTVRLRSKTGKDFLTLDNLKPPASIVQEVRFECPTLIFDGEVCVIDKNGDEDFKAISKEIRRKNHTIKNPAFRVFDVYHGFEFETGVAKNNRFYHEVYRWIRDWCEHTMFDGVNIYPVDQIPVTNMQELAEQIETKPEHWEGLMLRQNSPTVFSRSNNMLKVKAYCEDEAFVNDVVKGVNIIGGRDTECVVALKCTLSNNEKIEFRVGSGLGHREKLDWFAKPSLIVGHTITFGYFQTSKNQRGGDSFRHAWFKTIRDNGE